MCTAMKPFPAEVLNKFGDRQILQITREFLGHVMGHVSREYSPGFAWTQQQQQSRS